MKFTLTYDGELRSSGNGSKKIKEKWEVRRHIHPQLEGLWDVHPALIWTSENPYFPRLGTAQLIQTHHTHPRRVNPVAHPHAGADMIHLTAPISRGGRLFRPVVRNNLALVCSLNILFMRREAQGHVYQGGDLDNRVKTLLDALSVPPYDNHVVDESGADDTIFCLLEDDSLVTGLNVQTQRLLGRPGASESEVRLVIDVDVRVADARIYNQVFLGD